MSRAKKRKTKLKRSHVHETPVSAVAKSTASGPSRDLWWGVTLFLAVILTYSPVWWAGYIWDDAAVVTANPVVAGPLGLKEIWTTKAADICPLTLTTFWIEYRLWGSAPLPYHLVNVLMHGASSVLLWRLLLELRVPGAWLGAALWALHPVQVESVAWTTEMKNTESCFFYLLSILFFVRLLKKRNDGNESGWTLEYALTLAFAAMAMASKSSTVILPVVLCLCAWWVARKWDWRYLIWVSPLFLMSLVSGLVSIWTQDSHVANAPLWARSWPERIVTAGDIIWFYLAKLIWPHPLMMVYPRWQINVGDWISYLPLLAVIIVFSIFWARRDLGWRPWLFVFLYFVVALCPVMGLLNLNYFVYSQVADRFQYLASMAPLALVGSFLFLSSQAWTDGNSAVKSLLAGGLLLVLGIASWRQAWTYQNGLTLWIGTLAHNPSCWVGENEYGDALAQDGQTDEGIAHLRKALEIAPDYALAHGNLGTALTRKGDLNGAIPEFRRALEIDPNYVDAYSNLGWALVKTGHVEEAVAQCRKAVDIDPNNLLGHVILGIGLFEQDKIDEAILEYQKALVIDPHNLIAHNNLGNAFSRQGKLHDAIIQLQEALRLQPDSADIHYNLGLVFLREEDTNSAIEQFRKCLEINPGDASAHNSLGEALVHKGQVAEAITEFQEALRLKPDDPGANKDLAAAQAMLQKRNGLK